jgi:8-oxo-dGTP pyrophosphatase MutT (NUDIX family)
MANLPACPSRKRGLSPVARTDYFNDPQAPAPNSVVPAASSVVVNEAGELLLQRRSDNGQWALPGGTMDLGETLAQTVVREVKEETGLDVDVTGVVGIYSDPGHVIEYDDGEVRQEFNVCFSARMIGGRLSSSAESTELRWVAPAELEALPMHQSTRLRIRHYLERRAVPYVD